MQRDTEHKYIKCDIFCIDTIVLGVLSKFLFALMTRRYYKYVFLNSGVDLFPVLPKGCI